MDSTTAESELDLPQSLVVLICNALNGGARPFILAICGWADTGKSTLAARVCSALDRLGVQAASISTDDFMLERAKRNALGISGYDTRSLDVQDLRDALAMFAEGKPFGVHRYDNRTGTRSPTSEVVTAAEVLVVEGIHSLHAAIASQSDLKVFIDSDEDTLRQLRYRANILKRGMTPVDAVARISNEWNDYSVFVRPRIESADLVVRVDLEFKYRCVRGAT
ncbi:MAG: hypothetical protein HUU30_11130 [Burkholderiaceae bacterium]|jgi:uridine kinase|nr:hypothetical protein [Aquabacterium sp.]NUP86289.1 hypothetical protein [Burkholderiaceae bacterium]